MRTCVHAYMRTCVHACMHACIHADADTHEQAQAHAHARTHTPTLNHTPTQTAYSRCTTGGQSISMSDWWSSLIGNEWIAIEIDLARGTQWAHDWPTVSVRLCWQSARSRQSKCRGFNNTVWKLLQIEMITVSKKPQIEDNESALHITHGYLKNIPTQRTTVQLTRHGDVCLFDHNSMNVFCYSKREAIAIALFVVFLCQPLTKGIPNKKTTKRLSVIYKTEHNITYIPLYQTLH